MARRTERPEAALAVKTAPVSEEDASAKSARAPSPGRPSSARIGAPEESSTTSGLSFSTVWR